MHRPLIIGLTLVAAAAAVAEAQPRWPYGGATMPRPVAQSDPLGPRNSPNGAVAESVARYQIEQQGYHDVHGLMRVSNDGWQALARGADNAAVVVTLDAAGKASAVR
jgi:hypothetical protein